MQKIKIIINTLIPKSKINYFVISLFVVGLIGGSIFFYTINHNDKNACLEMINHYISSISTSNLNNVQALLKMLFTNYIILTIIFLISFSLIGIIFPIFYLFFKGFTISFVISCFFNIYKIKGLLFSLSYLLFGEIFNIIGYIILAIYSINTSTLLAKKLFSKNNISFNKTNKKLIIIYFLSLGLSTISMLLQNYLLPAIIKITN